jgi:hypothetical protein
MNEQQWVDANAAQARRALANTQVRAEMLGLLGGDDSGRRRRRRLEQARRELAGLELRWRLEEDPWEPSK